jgi:hypothetical protein
MRHFWVDTPQYVCKTIKLLDFLNLFQNLAMNHNQLKMKDITQKSKLSAVTIFNVTPITIWLYRLS